MLGSKMIHVSKGAPEVKDQDFIWLNAALTFGAEVGSCGHFVSLMEKC